MNCVRSVHEFITEANKLLEKFCSPQTVVFIATNEQNAAYLDVLRKAGFKLSDCIARDARSTNDSIEVDTLREYILSLTLMCDAKYFFAWGESSSHPFLKDCRNSTRKKHIDLTYINKVVYQRPK